VGKGRESVAVRSLPSHFSQVSRANVAYQTFLPNNRTRYFEVNLKAVKQESYSQGNGQIPPPRSLLILAEQELDQQLLTTETVNRQQLASSRQETETSRWLNKTQ